MYLQNSPEGLTPEDIQKAFGDRPITHIVVKSPWYPEVYKGLTKTFIHRLKTKTWWSGKHEVEGFYLYSYPHLYKHAKVYKK
jgi:hypothetical protein